MQLTREDLARSPRAACSRLVHEALLRKRMRALAVLAAATAIELCILPAVVTAVGLAGAWNGWLDLVNVAAPVTLAVAGIGAVAARAALPAGRTRSACQVAALLAATANLVLFGPG